MNSRLSPSRNMLVSRLSSKCFQKCFHIMIRWCLARDYKVSFLSRSSTRRVWGFKWLGLFGNNSKRNFPAILSAGQGIFASEFQHNRLRIGVDPTCFRVCNCRRIHWASVLLPLCTFFFVCNSSRHFARVFGELFASESTKTRDDNTKNSLAPLFGTFGL